MINFEQGSNLAKRQDRVFEDIRDGYMPSKQDLAAIKGNAWVKMAFLTAPSNLVVRHFCLLDLISNEAKNYVLIAECLKKLAPDLWAEGFSYWKYTEPFLALYVRRFWNPPKLPEAYATYFNNKMKKVEEEFIASGYQKDDMLYPAPFGDLRNEPIGPINGRVVRINYDSTFLQKRGKEYTVKDYPIGLNTHTPKESKIIILNGYCYGFKFYEGYDKKYKNKAAEIADTLSFKRILSIFK